MASSSARYSTLIQPEKRWRRLVIASGLVLALTGVVVVAKMPVSGLLRGLLLAAWLCLAGAELWRTRAFYRRVIRYRLYSDGAVDLLAANGGISAATMTAGSVVTPAFAWLCTVDARGRAGCELISGNVRKNKEWRRFQVICRLRAAC